MKISALSYMNYPVSKTQRSCSRMYFFTIDKYLNDIFYIKSSSTLLFLRLFLLFDFSQFCNTSRLYRIVSSNIKCEKIDFKNVLYIIKNGKIVIKWENSY